MERKDVNANLAIINEKLAAIKEERENNLFIYVTRDKYLEEHGYVNELPTIKDVVLCQKEIMTMEKAQNELTDTDTLSAMEELGLDTGDIEQTKPVIILGFPVKYWKEDLKTRIEELASDKLLADLENAKELLEKNRSSDDIFASEMASVSSLLN